MIYHKNQLVIFLFILSNTLGLAQVDTIFKNEAYISMYSTKLKAPIIVKYLLYKGGGDCKRNKFHFKSNDYTATNKDYAKSGYDKGHLANAEDFAYDCKLDSLTFMYYNCFPQTPELNRGKWKNLESEIRKQSQNDSLIIITGGLYNEKKIGTIAVPDTCWKIVYSISKKSFSNCHIFTNTNNPNLMIMSMEEFNLILQRKYKLNLHEMIPFENVNLSN